MHRRRFLGALAGLPLASMAHAVPGARAVRRITFPVAGLAHNGFDARRLAARSPVRLVRSTFDGAPCFEIRDVTGMMIGYVPQQWVSTLAAGEVMWADVATLRPHALPWRQVEVAVVFAAAISSGNDPA
jgi:hypothetical protein